MLARERLIEIGVSVGVVAIIVATLYLIGLRETVTENGHDVLTTTGGELVVYTIVGFILLLGAAGLLLLRSVTVVEAEEDSSDDF